MLIPGVAQEFTKGAIGGIQKARIIIYKMKEDRLEADKQALMVSELLAGTKDLVSGGIGKEEPFHVMKVQFNPSTVRFEASADAVFSKGLEDSFDSAIINQQKRKASVVMSVDLIFDAVNNKDAFHGDKFKLSATDAVQAAGTIAQELKGGYSVQKQTNGFIGAMMHESTRVITFVWSKMLFTGAINQVQARYTMFSTSGRPIRSTVTLQLHQVIDRNDISYWDNAFSKFFGKQGVETDLIQGKSDLDNMRRLLNIGF